MPKVVVENRQNTAFEGYILYTCYTKDSTQVYRAYSSKVSVGSNSKKTVKGKDLVVKQYSGETPEENDEYFFKVDVKSLQGNTVASVTADAGEGLPGLLPEIKPETIPASQINPFVRRFDEKIPLSTKIDTSKPFVQVHGRFSNSVQTTGYRFPGQELPLTVFRSELAPNVQVGALPFSTGFFYSSADGFGHDINSVSFRLDTDKFKENLKAELENKQRLEQLKGKARAEFEDTLMLKYTELKGKLNSKKYQDKLKLNRELINSPQPPDTFSNLQNNFHFSKAEELLNQHRLDSAKLLELEKTLKDFDVVTQSGQLKRKFKSKYRFKAPGKDMLKSNLKNNGLLKKGNSAIYDINSFQLGNCYPLYGPLIMHGTSITGISTEYTPGKFYSSVSAGVIGNSVDPRDFGSKRNILATSIGYGDEDEIGIRLTYLTSKDDALAFTRSAKTAFQFPQQSNVAGISAKGAWRGTTLEGQVARSTLRALHSGNNIKTGTSLTGAAGINEEVKGNAYQGRVTTLFGPTNTQVYITSQMIEPGYYSPGTPFLPSDFFGTEAGLSQPVLKSRLTLNASGKTGYDNLSGTKSAKTVLKSATMSLRYSPKKLPFLQASYMPLIQETKLKGAEDIIVNRTDVYSAATGYTIGKKAVRNMLTGTASLVEVNSYNGESSSFTTVNGNNMLLIGQFSISAGSTVLWENTPQLSGIINDLSISTTLKKYFITVGANNYQKLIQSYTRRGIYAKLDYRFLNNLSFYCRSDIYSLTDGAAQVSNDLNYAVDAGVNLTW